MCISHSHSPSHKWSSNQCIAFPFTHVELSHVIRIDMEENVTFYSNGREMSHCNHIDELHIECLHFIPNKSAILFFPSSTMITSISMACLMLETSTHVAFAWLILCLATNRLSLASLETSKILVIATMLLAWDIKRFPLVNGLEPPPTFSKLALGTFSIVVVLEAEVVMCVNNGDGVLRLSYKVTSSSCSSKYFAFFSSHSYLHACQFASTTPKWQCFASKHSTLHPNLIY